MLIGTHEATMLLMWQSISISISIRSGYNYLIQGSNALQQKFLMLALGIEVWVAVCGCNSCRCEGALLACDA